MGFCRPCIGNVFSPVTATQNDCSSFPALFLNFFCFMICISAILCYITHHSLRMRDEVLEVKVNKI